jgi:prolyl-tRNA editing enzyme YbaK/EbsC (Cys-tRNA(Pro) deacylase)
MPVYCEKSVAGLARIYINGGARGFLVGMSPQDLYRVLKPESVEVAIE